MNWRKWARLAFTLFSLAGLAAACVWWLRPPDPDEQLRVGRSQVTAGNMAAALETANNLAAGGHNDHSLLLKADIKLHEGQYEAALHLTNQIQDQGDIRREAIAIAGQCLLRLQNLPEATRAFSFVLSERPDHVDGHRGLAAVYFDQGALLKCLYHLGEVARLDPNDGRPHRLMGIINADLDHAAEAAECFRQALRRKLPGANFDKVRVDLAEQLVKLGQHSEAIEILRPVDETEPKTAAIIAEAEWALGRSAKAVERLDSALLTSPNAPSLLRLRGQLHNEAREWKSAAALLSNAVRQDPSDLTSLHQLALAYDRLNQSTDAESVRKKHKQVKDDLLALTDLNREADDRPWDPDVRLKLAEICDRLAKHDLAKMWRESAKACRPKPPNGDTLPTTQELPPLEKYACAAENMCTMRLPAVA